MASGRLEARAVEWSAVDLAAGTLTVNAQMNRRHVRVPPKTKKAGRTVRIDPETVDRLNRWADRKAAYRVAAGPAWASSDLVATTRSGLPIGHRNFHRSLTGLCARTGIDPPISAYELRHTAISLQAEAGHAAWQIADWAGTSEAMISRVYRHRLRRVSGLRPAHR